ncbi:MAG TPA: Zn-ribbon domain-containing OB-fold protein [Dehalococcoidia bacterium]|nr:Zn-ribbon domain-containing OB-fold protein [Dehalococcoidia bacterium]
MAQEIRKPLPQPTDTTRPFWQGARQGELRLQRCRSCHQYVYYPRSLCPHCLSTDLDWVPASGRGHVYTYTVIRRAAHPAFREDVPYVLAVVELEEGPRLTTNMVGVEPEQVHIGMPVEAVFEPVSEDIALVKFRPRQQA